MAQDSRMVTALSEVIEEAVRLLRLHRPEMALELLDAVTTTLNRGATRGPQLVGSSEGEAA